MIGDKYWATGIIARYGGERDIVPTWACRLEFYDDGFAQSGSTEGELSTRYFEGNLVKAIETLKADAKKLGIISLHGEDKLNLMMEGDGENKDWPPPDNWREILKDAAQKTGLIYAYGEEQ